MEIFGFIKLKGKEIIQILQALSPEVNTGERASKIHYISTASGYGKKDDGKTGYTTIVSH